MKRKSVKLLHFVTFFDNLPMLSISFGAAFHYGTSSNNRHSSLRLQLSNTYCLVFFAFKYFFASYSVSLRIKKIFLLLCEMKQNKHFISLPFFSLPFRFFSLLAKFWVHPKCGSGSSQNGPVSIKPLTTKYQIWKISWQIRTYKCNCSNPWIRAR
jgi:hypothetical protein